MNPLIIGDVHGKLAAFEQRCQQHPARPLIQLGDFGFKRHHDWLTSRPYAVRVCFGNHDWLPYRHAAHSLGDFAQPWPGLFTVRGAHSIDQLARTEGVDWFADEELTYREGLAVLAAYEAAQPEIVISHDCPQSVRQAVFHIPQSSLTTQLLQALFEVHQPRLWVHGHHHRSHTTDLEGTRFVGLAELEVYAL